MSVLRTIVESTRREVEERKRTRPVAELEARLSDAPAVRSLYDAMGRGFGVVAEYKRRSPSGGDSDPDNLSRAQAIYAETPWVVAVSVLTDGPYFGGSVDDLVTARTKIGKPVLRKD